MRCRVLVVDDQQIPRQLFENTVAGSERYTLVAALDSAAIADAFCAAGSVDLILMDIVTNDGTNGLEAAKRIKSTYPGVKIILVTSLPDALFLEQAEQIGVDSFWYKELQAAPLLEVMDRTMAGEHIWPDRPPETQLGLAKSSDLTDRELDVLRLLAKGLSDREISDRLHLSFNTVRYHVDNLMDKTGQNSRTALAVSAVLSGIVFPGIGTEAGGLSEDSPDGGL